jgi:hypothetical protein
MNTARELIGGRYRLLEIIGAGGTGRVWLADDELLRRRVAVKEIGTPAGIDPDHLLDTQLTTMSEARAAARLEHPGVVAVYDVVWRPDRAWIVMEYVESRSLDAVIHQNGPLPHREVTRIGLDLLAALAAAHAAGVVHGDVKPHNVLLATDGRVVLTDFALATVEHMERGFLAPERLHGADAGEAGDLWSLGATLYAAVEGRAPFQRATTTAVETALMTEPPDPADHPGPLTPIIDWLLTKDPARRPTAADTRARLQRVLDRAVGVVPMPAAPPVPAQTGQSAVGMAMILDRMATGRPAPDRMARGTRTALIAAAVLLIATTGAALALHDRPGPQPLARVTNLAGGPIAGCAAGGPTVTGSTEARGYAVPTGWLWHSDPAGFDVAVPKGWTRSQDGIAACFVDPSGNRSFRVDASARMAGPADSYWAVQEQDALAAGNLPGYQRRTLGLLPEKQGGAAWEFTWQPDGEPARRHERRMLLPMGDGRAYLVEWAAPDQDWTGTEPYLRLVLASLS